MMTMTVQVYDRYGRIKSALGSTGGSGSSYYQTIEDNGTPLTQRPVLNLIEGSGITLTIADNAGNTSTDVTVTATGGSGGTDEILAWVGWFA
jgi:hypothetical protein